MKMENKQLKVGDMIYEFEFDKEGNIIYTHECEVMRVDDVDRYWIKVDPSKHWNNFNYDAANKTLYLHRSINETCSMTNRIIFITENDPSIATALYARSVQNHCSDIEDIISDIKGNMADLQAQLTYSQADLKNWRKVLDELSASIH